MRSRLPAVFEFNSGSLKRLLILPFGVKIDRVASKERTTTIERFSMPLPGRLPAVCRKSFKKLIVCVQTKKNGHMLL
jgi:hypothetical protein